MWAAIMGAAIATANIGTPSAEGRFDPKVADFSLRIVDETAAFRDRSAFLMPDQTIELEVTSGPAGEYRLATRDGVAVPRSARRWRWTAPTTPGSYSLQVTSALDKDGIAIH